MSKNQTRLAQPWRIALWSTIAMILAAPALAMRFSNEVNWGPGDFVVAGGLLGLAGLGLELAAQAPVKRTGRLALSAAILGLVALVWAELAVGLF